MKVLKSITVLCCLFLIGCASGATVKAKFYNDTAETKKNILIEPYQSLGINETTALKNGDVTVVKGVFPDILFGEYYPGRIKWNFWAVSESGQEFYGQTLFAGIDFSGHFLEIIIIDGKIKKEDRVKGVVLSTFVDYAYDLGGKEIALDRAKFLKDANYRKTLILKEGTSINDVKSADNILPAIESWNKYDTPEGILISPLGEDELKLIAGINPQYSFSEKLIGTGRFSITMDPVGTAVGVAIDLFRASGNVPTLGWDFSSQLPNRRNMAFIIKYVSAMKQELIENINKRNIEKLLTKGDNR